MENFVSPSFFVSLFWHEPFLILDELFLHQKVIFDSFHFEKFQATAGMGSDERKLGCSLWTLHLTNLTNLFVDLLEKKLVKKGTKQNARDEHIC